MRFARLIWFIEKRRAPPLVEWLLVGLFAGATQKQWARQLQRNSWMNVAECWRGRGALAPITHQFINSTQPFKHKPNFFSQISLFFSFSFGWIRWNGGSSKQNQSIHQSNSKTNEFDGNWWFVWWALPAGVHYLPSLTAFIPPNNSLRFQPYFHSITFHQQFHSRSLLIPFVISFQCLQLKDY